MDQTQADIHRHIRAVFISGTPKTQENTFYNVLNQPCHEYLTTAVDTWLETMSGLLAIGHLDDLLAQGFAVYRALDRSGLLTSGANDSRHDLIVQSKILCRLALVAESLRSAESPGDWAAHPLWLPVLRVLSKRPLTTSELCESLIRCGCIKDSQAGNLSVELEGMCRSSLLYKEEDDFWYLTTKGRALGQIAAPNPQLSAVVFPEKLAKDTAPSRLWQKKKSYNTGNVESPKPRAPKRLIGLLRKALSETFSGKLIAGDRG